MSIFKNFTSEDVIIDSKFSKTKYIFDNSASFINKSSGGWELTKNTSFSNDTSITSSFYFVDGNKFGVFYASSSNGKLDEYINWTTLMNTLDIPYDYESGSYDFRYQDNNITQVIAITFNPSLFEDRINENNFFIVLSASNSNSTYYSKTDGNFPINQVLTLAPYTQYENTYLNNNTIYPAYDLYAPVSGNSLVTLENGKVIVSWDSLYRATFPTGILYPELGLVLLFPELFNFSSVVTSINSLDDKSLSSAYAIQYVGAQGVKKEWKRRYNCKINPNEFDYTSNNSAFKKINNSIKLLPILDSNNIYSNTSYITKIGLYNDWNELLGVIYLSKPDKTDDMNFQKYSFELKI